MILSTRKWDAHVLAPGRPPVSSSQAIVGSVLEVGLVGGLRTVSQAMLAKIAAGWILTPITAGLLAYVLIKGILMSGVMP